MKTNRFLFTTGLLLPGFLLVALAGCSASDKGAAGSGGSGGSGTTTPGAALLFDSGGFVAMDTNMYGVQGAFFAYGDGLGDMKCQAAGHTACSTAVMTPDVANKKICATGTAAIVPGGAAPTQDDYSSVFGAGIGLDLNNPGGDAGVKGVFNATAKGVTGIGFTVTGPSGTGMGTYGADFRVEFLATGQDSIPPNINARFDTVGGTNGALGTDGSVLARFDTANISYATTDTVKTDATKLLAIQWHVATNSMAAIPYGFCLGNIHLLTN